MAIDLSKPYNREEQYLSAIADIQDEIPAKPYNRKEMYYEAISKHVDSMEDDIEDLQGRMTTAEAKIAAMATDMKYKGSVDDYEHLPTDAQRGDVYTTRDTGKEYVFDGEEWIELGKTVNVEWGAITGDIEDQEDLQEALAKKQDIKPYVSLERNDEYLYTVTFDTLPEYANNDSEVTGGCTSFVRGGKLYRNLDWNYTNAVSFRVVTKEFEGISFDNALTSTTLDDDKIGQLPYHVTDGVNKNGIMVSTHVLYNDWNWEGTGNIKLTKLPYEVLTRVKSMNTIATDLADVLNNLVATESMAESEYLLQVLVTDGKYTYIIAPSTTTSGVYELINATTNPKLTNFRWVSDDQVVRGDLQTRPTGVERWNMIDSDVKLSELRFTIAYELSNRLSEFIGIDGTTKDSTDAELLVLYNQAHAAYEDRTRDGETWQTMHSVVYGINGIERLSIQENWNKDYAFATKEYVDSAIKEVEDEIPELLGSTGQSATAGMTQKAITDELGDKQDALTAGNNITIDENNVISAAGGEAKELTTADYNYPASNPDGVAIWKLDAGMYYTTAPGIKVYHRFGVFNPNDSYTTFIVGGSGDGTPVKKVVYRIPGGAKTNPVVQYKYSNLTTGDVSSEVELPINLKVDLDTTTSGYALDATQGKVLKDMINTRVPAPTSADADKFLKGDGTWAAAGGDGGVKVLTTADYDYPESNPTSIAYQNLSEGLYAAGEDIYIGSSYHNETSTVYIGKGKIFFRAGGYGGGEKIVVYDICDSATDCKWNLVRVYDRYLDISKAALVTDNIVDNLNSTEARNVLSAYQGKVLKDLIDTRVPAPTAADAGKFLKGDGTWASATPRTGAAPTEATVGVLGEQYICTTAGAVAMYLCTAVDNTDPTNVKYTWRQLCYKDEAVLIPETKSMLVPDKTDISDGEVDMTGIAVVENEHTLRI